MSEVPDTGRNKRGFAAMDPARRREIASMGGRAAHAQGRAYQWDSKAAAEAGRKRHQKDPVSQLAAQAQPESPPYAGE